jgi:hypothetical protein
MVLCLLALPTIWFVCKVVRTADRAADVFVREHNARYDMWTLKTSFSRRYATTAMLTLSPCSILDGNVLELSAKVRDAHGVTATVYACFSGWWWKKINPSVYITDASPAREFFPRRFFVSRPPAR